MINSKFKLNNRNAFILGGSGTIGSSVSFELAKAGAKVLILDVNKKSAKKIIEKSKKLDVSYYFFNCSKVDALENELKKIIREYFMPDIFINCSYPRTNDWTDNSFKKINLKSFTENMDIHLNSYAWTAKVIADNMVENEINGSIIMTSSIYGKKAQDLSLYQGTNIDESMTYPIIKSGIIHLGRQMASYYGKYGIRVNTVCPGGLEGPIAGKKIQQDEIFKKRYVNKTPLGRMAKPEDVANLMVFLSSDASSYITGQSINVDGGISIV